MIRKRVVKLTCEKSVDSAQEIIIGGAQKAKNGTVLTRKTILLVGGNGSGKSSLIDAFANYLYDVKENDDFRYTVFEIPENYPNGSDPSTSTAATSTRSVTCYVMHNTKLTYPIAFVDTPSLGELSPLETFELIRKWYLSEYYCAVEEFEIWYLIKANEARISYDVWQVLNSVVREIEYDFVRVFPLITHASKREPRIALSSLARIGYIGLRENEDYYTFNTYSVLNVDCDQIPRTLSFADNYKHMELILKSLDKHFRWVSISDGSSCATAVQINLSRGDSGTKFYTTGSFRRSYRVKKNFAIKPPKIPEEADEVNENESGDGRSIKILREVPQIVMPKMEVNIPSRFVKEHEVGEEFEVIRFRRAKVKNFSQIYNGNEETNAVVSSAAPMKTVESQIIKSVPDLKNKHVQTVADFSHEIKNTEADCKDNYMQTECNQETVGTKMEGFMADASVQTNFTKKSDFTQTIYHMVDVCMQTSMDFYFKPIREHSISDDDSLTVEGKQNAGPSFNNNEIKKSSRAGHQSLHTRKSSFEDSKVIPLFKYSATTNQQNPSSLQRSVSHTHSGSREITPIILTLSPEMKSTASELGKVGVFLNKESVSTVNKKDWKKENFNTLSDINESHDCLKGRIQIDSHMNNSHSPLKNSISEYRLNTNISNFSPWYSRETHNHGQNSRTYSTLTKIPDSQPGKIYDQLLTNRKSITRSENRVLVETGVPSVPNFMKSGQQKEGLLANSYNPGITLVRWNEDNAISLYEEKEVGTEKERRNITFDTLV